jgi:hypothetical protein
LEYWARGARERRRELGMPGGYAQRLTDVYQKYTAFSSRQGPTHPSRELVAQIASKGWAQRLIDDLKSLENYYRLVEEFSDLAGQAKSSSSRALKQRAEDIEGRLGSQAMLDPFSTAAKAALRAIPVLGGPVSHYIDEKTPGSEEDKLLTDLMNELQSISNELRKDLEAYSTNMKATLDELWKHSQPARGTGWMDNV